MKRKISVFLLIIFSVLAGRINAYSIENKVPNKIDLERAFVRHWDSIPGTDNDKKLAMACPNQEIQVTDTLIELSSRDKFGCMRKKRIKISKYILYTPDTQRFLIKEVPITLKEGNWRYWLISTTGFLLTCLLLFWIKYIKEGERSKKRNILLILFLIGIVGWINFLFGGILILIFAAINLKGLQFKKVLDILIDEIEFLKDEVIYLKDKLQGLRKGKKD